MMNNNCCNNNYSKGDAVDNSLKRMNYEVDYYTQKLLNTPSKESRAILFKEFKVKINDI